MGIYEQYIESENSRKFRLSNLSEAMAAAKMLQNIEKSKNSAFSEIMTITPTDAKNLLGKNPNNRALNQKLIKTIAEDIVSNRWMLNGESIIISKEGELNDGQHRLLAICLANKPVQALVFFGADRDSRHTVDISKPRTVANLLSMEGIPNYIHASAIAKIYLHYRHGKFSDGGSAFSTKQQIRQEYLDYSTEIDDSIQNVCHIKFANLIGVTAACVAYIIIGKTGTQYRKEFFDKLLFGENIRAGDPILKAREHLLDLKARKATTQTRLEAILRYWNAWRRGIKVQRAISLYGEWPEVEK